MTVNFADLQRKAGDYLLDSQIKLIDEAYRFAENSHAGQFRDSGEPYIEHPLNTSLYLANLMQDAPTLAAGLLHDVVEDCGVPLSLIETKFGSEVKRLVDGVTNLSQMELLSQTHEFESNQPDQLIQRSESIRKMLVAMAQDIRVVLIKLCDRLHNMRTLQGKNIDKRIMIAKETLDIYAPLAHRLGIWDIKWQLEDLAFRHLDETTYRMISSNIAQRRADREKYLEEQCELLKSHMAPFEIDFEVYGRPKNIYSIHKKMIKYEAQGKEYSEIMDLYAIRILVDSIEDCYKSLGLVHQLWHPINGQFDDYIANPKDNMYQSLHTSVMCDRGVPLEVQVRTREMHRIAEYGVAAHWDYKLGSRSGDDDRFAKKMTWLRQLLDWQQDVTGADEFIESIKTDIFRDQLYVYTPKGDIRELPIGATPVDFAYRIHSELGNRCIGARVNSQIVALDTILKNGDLVEIISSRQSRGPSLDWLNPETGFVKTASARQQIRLWYRRQEKGAQIEKGVEIISTVKHRFGLTTNNSEIAKHFEFSTDEELMIALGNGSFSSSELEKYFIIKSSSDTGFGAQVEFRLEVVAWDRIGLLSDITTILSREKINISSVITSEPGDGTAIISLTLLAGDSSQMSRIFPRLDNVEGVIDVHRVETPQE